MIICRCVPILPQRSKGVGKCEEGHGRLGWEKNFKEGQNSSPVRTRIPDWSTAWYMVMITQLGPNRHHCS